MQFYFYIKYIILFSCVLISCNSQEQATQNTNAPISQKPVRERNLLPKDKTPNIQLIDLQNNAFTLQELKGKKIFFNIWATWCKPCVREMPAMQYAQQKLKDEYVFIAASSENMEKLTKFFHQTPYGFRFAQMQGNASTGLIPFTYIIDSNGKLAFTLQGAQDWDSDQMLQRLRAVP